MESADLERWTKHVNALPETEDPRADKRSIEPSPLMTEPSENDTEVLPLLPTNGADDQTEEFVLPPKPDNLADTVALELPPAKIPHRE